MPSQVSFLYIMDLFMIAEIKSDMGRLGHVSASTKVDFYIDDVIHLVNCILKSF